jgi:hypothetical protein
MGRLTRTAAARALGATPMFGAVAAVHPNGISGGDHAVVHGGVQADNGVIHMESVRILATDGVIHNQFAGGSGAVITPDDNGVIMSSD